MGQTVKVVNPLAEQVQSIFPCPRSRLKIWSRETGSTVLSRVSLLILHAKAESGAYLRNSSRFPRRHPCNRHAPPGQSRVYRVTQIPTDGVHCRESADTGPVIPKVVPVMGAAFASPWTNYCAPIFWCVWVWALQVTSPTSS